MLVLQNEKSLPFTPLRRGERSANAYVAVAAASRMGGPRKNAALAPGLRKAKNELLRKSYGFAQPFPLKKSRIGRISRLKYIGYLTGFCLRICSDITTYLVAGLCRGTVFIPRYGWWTKAAGYVICASVSLVIGGIVGFALINRFNGSNEGERVQNIQPQLAVSSVLSSPSAQPRIPATLSNRQNAIISDQNQKIYDIAVAVAAAALPQAGHHEKSRSIHHSKKHSSDKL